MANWDTIPYIIKSGQSIPQWLPSKTVPIDCSEVKDCHANNMPLHPELSSLLPYPEQN